MHFSSLQLAINLLFQHHIFSYCSGVSNRWTGFSTGTWDWKMGLDYLTGKWDWTAGLDVGLE